MQIKYPPKYFQLENEVEKSLHIFSTAFTQITVSSIFLENFGRQKGKKITIWERAPNFIDSDKNWEQNLALVLTSYAIVNTSLSLSESDFSAWNGNENVYLIEVRVRIVNNVTVLVHDWDLVPFSE